MGNFQAVYYRSSDGSEPVNDFIDRLSVKRQIALDNQIDRLNMLNPSMPYLPFPHSSQVKGELRELRCLYGRELYRVLYRRTQNLIVLLHIFRKDTGEIPETEIESGRHKTSVQSLQRVAEALGLRLVLGFESGPPSGRYAN